MAEKAILQVHNVCKNFGQLKALKDVCFEVHKGEILGIAGPNGAGKSTLFNVIAGNLQGTGQLLFEGKNINSLKPHQICQKGIARTFQIPVLFKSLNLYDTIRIGTHFGQRNTADEKKIIEQISNFLNINKKLYVETEKLDLLEKKKAMLAAALATNPRLLLLDEPMAGLHPAEIDDFKAVVLRINKEMGITIIIIEHLIKMLMEVSDRMMILYYGEKLCIGSPQEVVQDSKVIDVYLGGSCYATG